MGWSGGTSFPAKWFIPIDADLPGGCRIKSPFSQAPSLRSGQVFSRRERTWGKRIKKEWGGIDGPLCARAVDIYL